MTIQQHDKMKIHMRGYLIGRGHHKAYKAMDLMMEAFRDFRKDGVTPVWSHPLYIASVIRTLPLGEHEEAVLITAFLHDYFEDRPEMSWKLEENFDKDLLHYARVLDKNYFKIVKAISGKKAQNESYYEAILKHPYTIIVKAVDRYHNLKTMVGVFSDEKIEEYIVETEEFVLPMLKQGMRLHPEFEAILQNIKLGISTQIGLLRSLQTALAAKDQRIKELEMALALARTPRPSAHHPIQPPFTNGRDLEREMIATSNMAERVLDKTYVQIVPAMHDI